MPSTTYDPYGVSPQFGSVQRDVHNAWQGDTVKLPFDVSMPDGTEATRDNCVITFTLKDKRFFHDALWTGSLEDGIEFTRPGAVMVHIPERITALLRRGAYLYSLSIQTKMLDERKLLAEGTLQIEYPADAPNPSVFYNDNQEHQNFP